MYDKVILMRPNWVDWYEKYHTLFFDTKSLNIGKWGFRVMGFGYVGLCVGHCFFCLGISMLGNLGEKCKKKNLRRGRRCG